LFFYKNFSRIDCVIYNDATKDVCEMVNVNFNISICAVLMYAHYTKGAAVLSRHN